MPRGAKKDITVTKHLQSAAFFEDRRSFVSLDGHLFLFGEDKSRVRTQVFKRYKKCAVCGARAFEYGFQTPSGIASEWHHTKNCDCVECSEVRCSQFLKDCHKHRTVGFKRVANAD